MDFEDVFQIVFRKPMQRASPRIEFRIGPVSDRHIPTKESEIMSLVLTDIQQVSLTLSPVSAAGNPAKIDGTPSWSASDPTVLTVTPSADGMSAVVATTGKLADSVQVNVTADADLGDGVKTLTGTLDVSVTASQATALGIGTGVPSDRPGV